MQSKIDGPHVKGRQFRLEPRQNGCSLLNGLARAAAGGNADQNIGSRSNPFNDLRVDFQIGRGLSGFRFPCVNMNHRGTRFGRLNGLIGDVVRLKGEIRTHGGCMSAAGNGGRDDDFGHFGCFLSF